MYHITKSERPGRVFIQNKDGEGGDFSRVKFEAAVGMIFDRFQQTPMTPELAAKV